MASQTDICNLALGLIGAETISSLTEGSTESLACLVAWDSGRDAVLAAMDWSFARKRMELSQSSTTPDFGWDYQYPLPSDFLEPIEVNGTTDPNWLIEAGNILINDDELNLVYTARIEDTAKYPAMFVDAFAARLAADISPRVTRDFGLQQKMMQLFDFKIKEAQAKDANRQNDFLREDQDPDNYTWVSSRS